LLQKQYIETGKVKLVYRNFPLNQPAMEAAQMVQCADKDTRPIYLKVLFTTQEKWAYDASFREALAGIAVLGGMERTKFDECIANKDIQSDVLLVYQEAREKFRATSTPALFLGDGIIKGNTSFATVSKALDEALAALPKK
jgi:protein-disulfide isomerase